MGLDVESLSDAKIEDAPFKAILYGPAGAGKTHLMRDFPKPMLYLDADDKREPLMGVEGIDTIRYYLTDPKDAPKVWRKFWKDIQELKKDTKYATVVIDSMTSFDKILVRASVIDGGRQPMARPEIQHYGDVKNWYSMVFNVLKAINKNIIILAHEDYKVDSDSGVHEILPLITGSTSNEVASVFKDTWYLEHRATANGLVRTLHYQLFKKRICTSTTLAGAGLIENPTYAKLVQAKRKITKTKE